MTDYWCTFLTSDRHRKLNQLHWHNISAHLTNETSYWLKKLLVHINWAIYNVCDLNMDPHVCFFPTLSQDRARPILLAQPEACPQRSERSVCAHHTEAETATQGDLTPHRTRRVKFNKYCQARLLHSHKNMIADLSPKPSYIGRQASYMTDLLLAIPQTPVSDSCCLPLGALQSVWATWCKI